MSMNLNWKAPLVLSVASALLLTGCGNEPGPTEAVPAAAKQPVEAAAAPAAAEAPAVTPDLPDTATAPRTPDRTPTAVQPTDRTVSPDTARRPTPPEPTVPTGPLTIAAEPAEIKLGTIPTGDTGRGVLKLVNNGDTAVTIRQIKSSCGCTTSNFTNNTVLGPNESVDVDVNMKAGNVTRTISKKLTVLIEGQPNLIVPVSCEAKAFVEVTPNRLDPETVPDGKIVVTSTDGEPFKILSMSPDAITEFSAEPQVEHVLNLDWEKWNEVTAGRRNRKAILYLDHPKSAQVMLNVTVPLPVGERNPGTPPARQPNAQQQQWARVINILQRGPGDSLTKVMEENEIDLELADRSGTTMLAYAAKAGNASVVETLIAAGANIEASNNSGQTVLMNAAQSKNPTCVQFVIDGGADLDATDRIGRTALSVAAGLGDPDSVQALIDAGAQVEVVGSVTGFTPLIWAALNGDPGSVPILIAAGADLEAADALEGATPLIHAARTGHIDSLKALVDAGAELENTDRNGKTALLAAAGASNGELDKIMYLLEKGARLDAKDNRGLTALDYAKKRTDAKREPVIRFFEEKLGGDAAE